MKHVVISQPMYFPWVGMFEQIRLADIFIHLDDVPYSKGGFINRVQIKTPTGQQWLSAPVHRHGSPLIKDVQFDNTQDWRQQHIKSLTQNYSKAPHFTDMMNLVTWAFHHQNLNLSEFNQRSMEFIANYIGYRRQFLKASDLGITSSKSDRVLDLVKAVGGTSYITGWGARDYLDHESFDRNGINVEYMNYQKEPYPQLHGPFVPFVSILDLIANVGSSAFQWIRSGTVDWKIFTA